MPTFYESNLNVAINIKVETFGEYRSETHKDKPVYRLLYGL